MTLRLCKIVLLASLALHLLLIVFNNLTDYGSNLAFVRHVLTMDTTFEGNRGLWRSIAHPVVHHTFYAVIILWETTALILCAWGAGRLWLLRRAPAIEFNRGKHLAIVGLTVSLLLWFVAFLTIGGEWFLMWQSRIWNGQVAATRLFLCTAVILLVLIQPDTAEH
jgi:predicted small integral membrane protein